MDFGLDDPLESDDSFFEEPKALTRKSSASRTTATSEKKSLETLFGLEDKKSSDSGLGKTKPTVSFEETVAESAMSARQKSKDFLDLGEKKTDFLDDIFKPPKSSEKKSGAFDDIFKDTKIGVGGVKPATTPAVKEVGGKSSDFGDLLTAASKRRGGRRGSSTGIEDSLGILGDDFQSGDYFGVGAGKDKKDSGGGGGISKSTEDFLGKSKPTAATSSDVPDWLGGSLPAISKPETPPPIISKKPETSAQPNTDITDKQFSIEHNKQLNPQQINMEIQNTYSALHQQESFLLLTLQMKKYEETLNEIKERQNEMMGRQEKQLGMVLEEYVLKQQMVENNIRLQQERINNQIQMLMTKPVENRFHGSGEEMENTEEGDHRLFKAMKQRHEEELFIMEESYKKQINILETSNQNLEEKLKSELTSITQILEQKIDAMKNNYEEELLFYKEKLKAIEEQHQQELKLLKENHTRTLEELKEDHAKQLEYLKKMKQHESNLLENSEGYTQRIEAGIGLLVNSAKTLQELEGKVSGNYDILAVARENSIQTKEKEIILMRSSLEKCRQAAEAERSQLMALIRNLETKLAEQNHGSQEDRWALQQASATLTARASALEREAEYNRNAIEREREQLKTLKESMLAEQERFIMQLTEEKLALSSEKAKLEVNNKLTNTYDVERIKAEAQAAVQAAKDLTEKVSQERSNLYKQKSEMEALKRQLLEKETELNDKEVELEFLMQDAQRKLKEDKRVLTEAKMMENLYKDRLQELQQQWLSMSGREKKLAEEKVGLSKERLALYTALKTNKGCALCKNDLVEKQLKMHEFNKANLDADAFRLRLEVEDERESEVSREDNVSVHLSKA